jgi:hypothetical protein
MTGEKENVPCAATDVVADARRKIATDTSYCGYRTDRKRPIPHGQLNLFEF